MTKSLILVAVVFGGLLLLSATVPQVPAQPVGVQVWDMAKVLEKHRAAKRSYTRFFKVPSTHCGVYTLPKAGKDGQSPHGEDELYYVLAGKAKMESKEGKQAVGPGSLIFVAAQAEHRFVDIEEDLELLVVFSSGPRQEAKRPKK